MTAVKCSSVAVACLLIAACGNDEPAPPPEPVVDTQLEQPDAIETELLAVVDGVALMRDIGSDTISLASSDGDVSWADLPDDHPLFEVADAFAESNALTPGANSVFRRTGDQAGEVHFDDRTIVTQSVAEGAYLADAWLLRRDRDGYWIQQEELSTTSEEYKGQNVQRLRAVGSLRRYDNNLSLVESGHVALNKPRTTLAYFTIDADGMPFYLEYRNGGMRPKSVAMIPVSALAPVRSLEPLPEIISGDIEAELLSLQTAVRMVDGGDALLPGETTRDEIILRAEYMLNSAWTLTPENFSAARTAACGSGSIWRRPDTLTADRIGSEIPAPPYKWGGNSSIDSFLDDIEHGAVAGDVCTCRCRKGNACTAEDWCIDSTTAGFDCSGFVSRAWAIQYHSTSTLHNVATPVQWRQMETGDILNSPGKHVRLFVALNSADALTFEMMESSVGCGGLCRKSFRVSELTGYIPYRADHLAN